MPVIRSQDQASIITPEKRRELIKQLKSELEGKSAPGGPVIFEIPLPDQNRIDVLVIWSSWKPINSTDRSNMIVEAYKNSKIKIAQALGATYAEAIEQNLLPYSVLPMVRQGEASEKELRNAMLAQGGIALENGKVDLRFPTMFLAEQAHRHLADSLPKGYWSIAHTVGYIQ